MMNTKLGALVVLFTAMAAAPALAAAPESVALEGVLTSSGGGAAADGVYKMTFTIWDKNKDGTKLWSEGPVPVQTKGGQFHYALGTAKKIDAMALAKSAEQWVGITIESDPELPRQPLLSSIFALWAGSAGDVTCAGCIGKDHIANGAIGAAKLGATYAASDTAGGPATKAQALSCTGCVTVDQMKFDKDVDLGKVGLTTTGTIAATAFVGDGSKLTGIKTPTGSCTTAGEVMKGIDANGKPICVIALDAKNLPAGGLNEISAESMSNHFDDTVKGKANVDIPDNSSNGLLDIIDVPKIGKADAFEVYVEITKEPFVDVNPKNGKSDFDTRDLTVLLFPPTTDTLPAQRSNMVSNFLSKPDVDQKTFPHYILHSLGGDEGDLTLAKTYPTKDTPITGDIHKDWLGKDPAGKWRLLILDNKDRPSVTNDGKLVTWHIKVKTTSGNQVLIAGSAFINNKIWGKYNGHQVVQTGGKLGGTLVVGGDLQVDGALTGLVKFGTTTAQCTAAVKGTFAWVDKKGLQVCDGAFWVAARSKPVVYRGDCTAKGSSGWRYYCQNRELMNTAQDYLFRKNTGGSGSSTDSNYGRIEFKIAGYYKVKHHRYGATYYCGFHMYKYTKASSYSQSDILHGMHYGATYNTGSGPCVTDAQVIQWFDVGDQFNTRFYSANGTNWHASPSHTYLEIEYMGTNW